MNNDLKEYFNQSFEFCKKMDEGPFSIKAMTGKDVKAEDCLKLNLLQFLMYLSASDGTIAWQEAKFINEYFETTSTPETLNNYIRENNLYSTQFEQEIPVIIKYLVLADNALYKFKPDIDQFASELILKLFQGMAHELASCDGNVADQEKADTEIYLASLQRYIFDNLEARHQNVATGYGKDTGNGVDAPKKDGGVTAPKKDSGVAAPKKKD